MMCTGTSNKEANMGQINVQVDEHPNGLIARIGGMAGVDQVDEFDRQLNLLTALSPKFVVLDLSNVTYVSSMGIGSLLRFRNQIEQGGGKVVVAAPQANVAAVLRLGRIDRVLPIFNTVDAALKPAP